VTALLLRCVTGELASLSQEATESTSVHPDVLTVNAHFIKPTNAGSFNATIQVLKSGRTTATVSATLHQQGKVCIHALATCGDLKAGHARGPNLHCQTGHGLSVPPSLPPVDECVRLPARGELPSSVRRRIEIFLPPAQAAMFDFERQLKNKDGTVDEAKVRHRRALISQSGSPYPTVPHTNGQRSLDTAAAPSATEHHGERHMPHLVLRPPGKSPFLRLHRCRLLPFGSMLRKPARAPPRATERDGWEARALPPHPYQAHEPILTRAA